MKSLFALGLGIARHRVRHGRLSEPANRRTNLSMNRRELLGHPMFHGITLPVHPDPTQATSDQLLKELLLSLNP